VRGELNANGGITAFVKPDTAALARISSLLDADRTPPR
jgi:hypothetical protein